MQVNYQRLKPVFLAMVAIALVMSIVGMRDISTTPYSGYRVSSDYTVVFVEPGGPAAQVLKAGDRIKAVNRVPSENLYQLSRLSRTGIGETQELAILREGTALAVNVQHTALPLRDRVLRWGEYLMGLVMMGVGYAVFRKRSDKPAALFFLFNLFVALSLISAPYFDSFTLRRIVALNFLLFVALGLAFFLHLAVTFPKSKPLVIETPLELFIYLQVPLMGIGYALLRVFQPQADLLLNQVLHYAFGLLVLLCLGFAVAAVINSYGWATPAARSRVGMMVLGSLLGTIPIGVRLLTFAFLPRVVLPLSDCYVFPIILVTLSFAWALWNEEPQEGAGGLRQAA